MQKGEASNSEGRLALVFKHHQHTEAIQESDASNAMCCIHSWIHGLYTSLFASMICIVDFYTCAICIYGLYESIQREAIE